MHPCVSLLNTCMRGLGESGCATVQYNRTVRDGTLISFKVMDLFSFDPASGREQVRALNFRPRPHRTAQSQA